MKTLYIWVIQHVRHTALAAKSKTICRRDAGYFETQGTKLVVVACNTLTVLGVDTLKGNHEFDIVGMSKRVPDWS